MGIIQYYYILYNILNSNTLLAGVHDHYAYYYSCVGKIRIYSTHNTKYIKRLRAI